MRAWRSLGSVVFVVVLSACSGQVEPDWDEEASLGITDSELTAAAPKLPSPVGRALESQHAIPHHHLDRLFTLEHFIPIGQGRRIHVTETFTLRSWLRFPHRAVLMLPGPLTKGSFFNIPVEGYEGREIMARRGFFAVSADYEGAGLSTYPADGRTVKQDTQTAAMRRVVQYFRVIRFVPRVDVIGESWGGGVAAELCADARRVRSCVLASMLYKTASEFADQTFRSPAFRGFLDTLPDGYLTTTGDEYGNVIGRSPPDVQEWFRNNQPGRYATGPLYDAFDLPFFDPTRARVPGLVISGELDPTRPPEDSVDLAHDYDAAGAELVVIPGAGHVPRIEPYPLNEVYWSTITEFVDP
jgi:pimeloyl-ACP methyl ester carboxylesterase